MKLVVRKYKSEDKKELEDVFRQIEMFGDFGGFWQHERFALDTWLTPYIENASDSLYIALIDEKIVGYLTGCLNTAQFPKLDDVMTEQMKKHKIFFRPNAMTFLCRAMWDSLLAKLLKQNLASGEFLDDRWPSHLHIDLIPSARGTGIAKMLMEHWLKQVKAFGSKGCYLETIVENTRAVRFFEKMGFKKYGEVRILPGMRGEQGSKLHQQIMVWQP